MRQRTIVIAALAVLALLALALGVHNYGGGMLRNLGPAIHGR